MADPIARAIQSYGALKNIEHQDAINERQEQQMDRQDRLDAIAMEDREKAAAIQTEDRAWQKKQRAVQEKEWNLKERERAKGEVNKILHSALLEAKGDESKINWGAVAPQLKPYYDAELLPEKFKTVFEPDRLNKELGATRGLLDMMATGKLDHTKGLMLLNSSFKGELYERGKRNGATGFTLVDAVPSPNADGFMFEAELNYPKGSRRAPLTVNAGTEDQGDNEVKNFRLEHEVAPYVVSKYRALKGIEAYLQSEGVIKPKTEKGRKVIEVGDPGAKELVYADTGKRVRALPQGPGVVKDNSDSSSGLKPNEERQIRGEVRKILQFNFIADYFSAADIETKKKLVATIPGASVNPETGKIVTDPKFNVQWDRVIAALPPEAQKQYNRSEQYAGLMIGQGRMLGNPAGIATEAISKASLAEAPGQQQAIPSQPAPPSKPPFDVAITEARAKLAKRPDMKQEIMRRIDAIYGQGASQNI